MRKLMRKGPLLLKLFLIYSITGLIGSALDHLLLSWLMSSLALLIYYYYYLEELISWLNNPKKDLPVANNIWGNIFDNLNELVKGHRRRRQELSILLRRFRLGSESIPDAVIILNHDLTITWCNRLAQSLLGLRWPKDNGQRIDNLLRTPEFIGYFHQLDISPTEEAQIFRSPAQDALFLEFRCMPYLEQQWMILVRDITKIHLTEQVRKDFIANVSHELRTPLTVMQGYLEMLAESELPQQKYWQKAHQAMAEQTERMSSLVNQLLKLSKIESTPLKENIAPIIVDTVFDRIKQSIAVINQYHHHQVIFNIESALQVAVEPEDLYTILSNLINNAIYYTENRGEVNVFGERRHHQVYFAVQDNGEGIPAKDIVRLTERFYRVDKARGREKGGSGLGLAIVKHALSKYGSELIIDSIVGEGSCFSFYLTASNTKYIAI